MKDPLARNRLIHFVVANIEQVASLRNQEMIIALESDLVKNIS